MADEQSTGQVAEATSETHSAGTTEQVMDAGASVESQQSTTPPSGTTDSSVTALEEATTTEASSTETETPEAKSRRERQAERRKQATPPPPPAPRAPTPDEIIAAHEARQAEIRQAQERAQAEFQRRAKYIGETPADPNNPQGPTVYQQLLNEVNAPLPDLPAEYAQVTPEQDAAHRAAVKRRNDAIVKLQEFNERRGLIQAEAEPLQQASRTEALNWIGNQFERGLADVGVDVQAVLSAGAAVAPDDRMPAIVKALAAQIASPLNARIAEIEDDLAAQKEETDSWRRRAGGSADQVLRGGSPANGTGGSVLQRLIQQAGSREEFSRRADLGEYAHIDLTK